MSHAWKCIACSRSYRAKSEPSRPPKCPTCGVALVPSSRKVAPPEPRRRVGSGAPVPRTDRASSRPPGPEEALAMVSSSAWLPDPEPPPSPDTSMVRKAHARNRMGDAESAAEEAPDPLARRYWIAAGVVAALILGLAVTVIVVLNRPAKPVRMAQQAPESQQVNVVQQTVDVEPTAVAVPASSVEARPEQPIPAALAGPRVVNLLKLIDPRKDTFTGTWKLHTGEFAPLLSSDATQHARLNIPYEPPEEYDFRVDFVRTAGDNCMAQMFTHNNPCALILFGWKGKVTGFQQVKNQFADHNSTGVHDLPTANGQRHTSVVKVRKHYIEAWLDGSRIIHYDTDGNDLGAKDWAIDTPLGVGSQTSPTLFQTIEITEITGQGHPLR